MSMLNGQVNIKRRAFTWFPGSRDKSIMDCDDALHDSQSNTSAGIFSAAMQALEELKYFVIVFWFKPDAIICELNMTIGFIRD